MHDQLKTVNLLKGAVTVLRAASDEVPNGMVLDNEGNLLICQQGSKSRGVFIQKIDLKTLAKTVVADVQLVRSAVQQLH